MYRRFADEDGGTLSVTDIKRIKLEFLMPGRQERKVLNYWNDFSDLSVADLITSRFPDFGMEYARVWTHPPDPLLLKREGGENSPLFSREGPVGDPDVSVGESSCTAYKLHTRFPKSGSYFICVP